MTLTSGQTVRITDGQYAGDLATYVQRDAEAIDLAELVHPVHGTVYVVHIDVEPATGDACGVCGELAALDRLGYCPTCGKPSEEVYGS